MIHLDNDLYVWFITRNEIDWKFISKFLLENQTFNHLKFLLFISPFIKLKSSKTNLK